MPAHPPFGVACCTWNLNPAHIIITLLARLLEMRRHNPSTKGEALYKCIEEKVLMTNGRSEMETLAVMQVGARTREHANYFFGFTCASIFRRLIKKTEQVLEEDRPAPEKTIARYIEETLEVNFLSQEKIACRLAALAISATESSHKDIPKSVIKAVNGTKNRLSCYICGNFLQKDSVDPTVKLTYEHIWPSCYGGDSIEENILPACRKCNDAKGDMILWHTAHVGAFCLKPNPSSDEMTRVTRSLLVAAHMKKIFNHATLYDMSLKESALQVGPISQDRHRIPYPDDARDFFNFEYE